MERNTLVLNRNYYAIHICDFTKTMALLYKGHAVAIDENLNRYDFNEWAELSKMIKDNPAGFINTVSLRIAIPEVICLTYYDELPKNEVKFSRKNLYKHYKYICCYCGKKFGTENLNLDHVLPRSKGGKTDWDNIVLSCYKCNGDKDNKTPKEAKMKMHYHPSKPKWMPSVGITFKTGIGVRSSWQKFINHVYWNTELDHT